MTYSVFTDGRILLLQARHEALLRALNERLGQPELLSSHSSEAVAVWEEMLADIEKSDPDRAADLRTWYADTTAKVLRKQEQGKSGGT